MAQPVPASGLTDTSAVALESPPATKVMRFRTSCNLNESVESGLDIGGKCDPSFGGGPLRLTGTVVHLSDGTFTGDGPILGGITHSFGPTAVVRVAGIAILVVTLPGQMLDLQQVRAFGIEPARLRFLVVSSMQHFRAAFEPIAGRVTVCDTGALATPQAHLRPYTRVKHPVWPLDRDGFAPGL